MPNKLEISTGPNIRDLAEVRTAGLNYEFPEPATKATPPIRELETAYAPPVRHLLRAYRVRIALSMLLVIGESVGAVLMPRVIGISLDDQFAGSHRGVIMLVAIGTGTMVLATVRRLHDVRLYSRVYVGASDTAVDANAGLSARTARLNLLREFVDFLEYSMPDLVMSLIAFCGTLWFLLQLSRPVFGAALVMGALIVGLYALTTRRTSAFNRGFNDEYERQVDVLGSNDSRATRRHIGLLNNWLIKLSDLDATNVAISLTLATGLQTFAIISTTGSGTEYGEVFSIVLYVFEFSAVAPFLSTSWQSFLRLRDILRRLRLDTPAAPA